MQLPLSPSAPLPTLFASNVCIIRKYRLTDAALLSESVSTSYDHLKRFMPWATETQTIAQSTEVIERAVRNYENATDFMLGIFSPDDHQHWGGCGYHLREGDLSNRAAEIGMWIRASKSQQGLGTQALRALIAWGFSEWPWERLSWRCDADNHASAQIALKAGMHLEGRLKGHRRHVDGTRGDTLCFGILKLSTPFQS